WQMLLGHHLGLKGKVNKLLAEKDERAVQLKETVDDLLELALKENLIKPAVIYQFFPAKADGNDLIIYDPADEKTEIERFTFPRQAK
uniref:vitamin B12 dependent-methionine synthase activation domain-containing protein n=2 Tax=Bacillales TaxID=1385 RepID=UPI0011A2A897